jgi:aspartate kinase
LKKKIGGIVEIANLARISLACSPEQARIVGELFENFGQDQINVQFIIQCRDGSENDMLVFCVDRDDQDRVQAILHSIHSNQKIKFYEVDPHVSCLGVYGPDFRIHPGLAGHLLGTLESSGIDIQAISTSLSTFSMVIPSSQVDNALAVIHQNFDLP